MNSIFLVIGCFLAILAVTAPYDLRGLSYSASNSKEVLLTPPFLFGYNWGDYLNVKVNFTNLSPDVVYTVYEAELLYSMEKQELNRHAGRDVYLIQKQIMDRRIFIYVELKTNAELCKNITVLEGIAVDRLPTVDHIVDPGFTDSKVCLSAAPPCTIEMDLKNACTGTPLNEEPQTSAKPSTQATSAKRESVDSGILTNSTFKPNVTTSPQNENVENTTARDNTNNEQQQSSPNLLIYVILSVIGMCVIILVLYISIKKYCHQNSHPVEPMELNTYATVNQVIYVDLSLLHGDSQPPRSDEESPYAKIIGVMKPVH